MRKNAWKGFELLFLTALFCFSVSLFNLSGYIFSAFLPVLFILFGSKIRLSVTDVWIWAYSVFYFLFYWIHFGVEISAVILYLLGPWTAYEIGKLYVENSRGRHSFLALIAVLSLGMYLHGILNILAYVRSDYFALYHSYRQSVDFWRNELVNVKATEMLYTFATGAALGVLFTTYKARYKAPAVVVLGVSLALTAFMANRALLIIFFVILLWRYGGWWMDRSVPQKNKILSVICIVLAACAVCAAMIGNWAGMGDVFHSLKIVQRFTSKTELTRLDVWSVFIDDLRFMDHPFGGKRLMEGTQWSYLHNMWLDVYNVAGIIPFMALIVLSLRFFLSIVQFGKRMRSAGHRNEWIVFQSLMMAVVLNMMIEPVIEANPYYFLMVMMLWGAMKGYKRKKEHADGGYLARPYTEDGAER